MGGGRKLIVGTLPQVINEAYVPGEEFKSKHPIRFAIGKIGYIPVRTLSALGAGTGSIYHKLRRHTSAVRYADDTISDPTGRHKYGHTAVTSVQGAGVGNFLGSPFGKTGRLIGTALGGLGGYLEGKKRYNQKRRWSQSEKKKAERNYEARQRREEEMSDRNLKSYFSDIKDTYF